MLFRTREMFVRQRTQLINALRGHLAEHGVVAPRGRVYVKKLVDALADENITLPEMVRQLGRIYVEQIGALDDRIAELDRSMHAEANQAEMTRRLQTMPGVGPITDCGGNLWPSDGKLSSGTRFLGLARARTAPAFNRWQATTG